MMPKSSSGASSIKPQHYLYEIANKQGESIKVDLFDIGEAMNLHRNLFTALRYFRVKTPDEGQSEKEKRVEDLRKSIQCIERYIEILNNEHQRV